jgi:hypothetical protein
MSEIIITIFLIGYPAIVFEHKIKLFKCVLFKTYSYVKYNKHTNGTALSFYPIMAYPNSYH